MELKKSLREIFLMGTSHPSPSPCQPITSRCPHIRKTLVRQAPHCRPWRQKDGGRVIGSSSGSHHACLCAATAESTNMSMEVARAYSELGELVQGPDVFTLRYTHRPETRRLRASSYRICWSSQLTNLMSKRSTHRLSPQTAGGTAGAYPHQAKGWNPVGSARARRRLNHPGGPGRLQDGKSITTEAPCVLTNDTAGDSSVVTTTSSSLVVMEHRHDHILVAIEPHGHRGLRLCAHRWAPCPRLASGLHCPCGRRR
jgi:hypothetical protein